MRNSFIKTKNLISNLDKSLNLIHFSDEILSTSSIMALIYMSTVGTQKTIKSLIFKFLFNALVFIFKLSMDCLIHGSVYEEIEIFFLVLEQNWDISVNNMDKNELREYLSFKTQINDWKLGFTITSFAPFNKSTFLSVTHIFIIWEAINTLISRIFLS